MSQPMRCPYCGLLQDEPSGVKTCARCGGGLEYESPPPGKAAYLEVQMELDQVAAPSNQNLERYLLITIRTPKQVPADEAAPTESGRPPVNFTAVLDVSGSMSGEKIAQAKEAVVRAVQYLHPGDIFSLVTFSNEAACPFEPNLVDANTLKAVSSAVDTVRAGGMTALDRGLELGIKKALHQSLDSNLVLLLSDGQANVGETDLEKIGGRALKARKKGLLASCIGLGLDYNEALLAEIATQGGGRFYHIVSANQIPAYMAGELGEVAAMAARDVKVYLDIPDGATLIPLTAVYPVQQAAGQAIVTVGEIPLESELEIPLRLALLAQPEGAKLSIQGRLEFRSPAGHQLECPVNRVTLRFVAQNIFQLRQGVVLPVAERVFAQMKASSVLGTSRLRARRRKDAAQEIEANIIRLRTYSELLGEERAEQEEFEVREMFSSLSDSHAASIKATADAHRLIRSSKDFNKK